MAVTISVYPGSSPDLREDILLKLSDTGGFTFSSDDGSMGVVMSTRRFLEILHKGVTPRQTPSVVLTPPPLSIQSTQHSSLHTLFTNSYRQTLAEGSSLTPLATHRGLVTQPRVISRLSLHFPSPLVFNHNAVINIVGEFIPNELLLVASLGKKFVPPILFDRERVLLDLSKIQTRDASLNGSLLMETISLVKSYTPQPLNETQKHIVHIFDVAKGFLNDNPNICISSADKGNISVVFDRQFYNQKINEHLSSSAVYQKVVASSHIGLIRRNHFLLSKLSDIGFLGREHIFRISSQETQTPMLYGVWKPFKGFSLRPILSSVNVVGNKLFQVLVDILNRLDHDNKYSLKNTSQLIKEVKALTLGPDDRLFSIDVVSMFTNIQPDLALSIILPKLSSVTNLCHETFKEIFTFVTKIATEFCCNGDTYKQVSGLPMGTKGSPVIASIVLTHIFDTILPNHQPVTYLKKYVDDTIFITTMENAHSILTSLNQFDPRIKFTMEEEGDTSSINFLDVTLLRESQTIITKWFCKPFSSNRLVNWYSEHEPHTIKNTAIRYISNMLFYSDIRFHDELMETAKTILFKNSFPSSSIDDFIIRAKEIVAFDIFGENDAENTQFFSTLAPIKVLSSINKLCLSNSTNIKYVNTYFDHNSGSSIFSQLKDPQNIDNLGNVIIRTSCKSCRFFRIVPVITPPILYKALKVTQLIHPFHPIRQHLSSSGHTDFRTKIERSCGSINETLRFTKLLCKKNKIPCPN